MMPDTPSQTQALPKLPDSTPQPPVFTSEAGTKPGRKSATPTFLGPNASPSVVNAGYKSLIGQ